MPSQRLQTECLSCKHITVRMVHKANIVVKGQIIMYYCASCRIPRHHRIKREI